VVGQGERKKSCIKKWIDREIFEVLTAVADTDVSAKHYCLRLCSALKMSLHGVTNQNNNVVRHREGLEREGRRK
jgi:hypothetical protein